MRITVITACRNSAATLADALESVRRQRLPEGVELEHVVIDGASDSDGTLDVVRRFESLPPQSSGYSFRWISEPDRGLYDALNKGIRMATGEVVGICNADDVLASDDVIARLAAEFGSEGQLDVVYADIRFAGRAVGLDALRSAPTKRYCTGRYFRRWMFRFATFPAHPSTFVRREWFEKAGWYSSDYGMYGDFEFMLRLFVKNDIVYKYVPLCTHVMRMNGASTGSFAKNVKINKSDLRALRNNGIWSCMLLIYMKYVLKIWGFVLKRNEK